MAEYIERAAILKSLGYDEKRRAEVLPGSTFDIVLKEAAADVAEVVRCQDCKYRIYKDMGDDIGMIGGCQVWGVALPGDFYCAHGAHVDKEDEHEAG